MPQAAYALKPGSASLPLPGIVADVVDEEGRSLPAGRGGYLVLRQPWPGMMPTIHGDEEWFRKSYWGALPHGNGSPTGYFHRLRLRREQAMLDAVCDHVIICGYGRMGQEVAACMAREDVPLLVIDQLGPAHSPGHGTRLLWGHR